MKLGAQTNKIEKKARINETQNLFFENICNINKLAGKLTKIK